MAAAHSFTAHTAVGAYGEPVWRNVLEGLAEEVGDFFRSFNLQRVVIDNADRDLLTSNLPADGLKIHCVRAFHLECDQVGVELIQDFESRFVRLHLREHPLLRWIPPTRVAPDFGFLAQSFHGVVENFQHEVESDVFVGNRPRSEQVNLGIFDLDNGTAGIREVV